MDTLRSVLCAEFVDAATTAFPDVESTVLVEAMEIAPATQEKFGHYQCNAAMKLAKPLRRSPREIGQTLLDAVQAQNSKMVDKLELAGPGFINIHLSSFYLSGQMSALVRDERLGVMTPENAEEIVIDFSSPNIAKEMHVGHLRSTIIGDSLARLFEFLGYRVHRLNHLGDWGTQFGMLIEHMRDTHPGIFTGEEVGELSQLVTWYREAKERFDDDEAFRERAKQGVVALQGGQDDYRQAWEVICEVSRQGFDEIYRLLNVEVEERGESYYNDMLADVIEELERKGLIQISEGAKCMFPEGFTNRDGDPLPLMLQKSDGGYNYDTTDMAAIRHRIEDMGATRLIYVTDAGQNQHFRMVFAAAEMAGWLDPQKVRCDHVPFGLVLGEDGKKFKTRSGKTEKLIDLLNEAVMRARVIIDERNSDMAEEERVNLAHAIGIGAVKYADLSCNRVGDYQFSYDRMLRFEGNTAAFLMYSYVRVNGIKRKVGADVQALIDAGEKVCVEHPSEVALALHLAQFGEVLEAVADELLPNRLTDYLYGLAQKFNAFFRDCRVEGSDEQNSRLLLCEAAAQVLRQGFHILGLQIVERM